jgi:hypothetical protein
MEAADSGQKRLQTTPQFTPRSDPDLNVIADAWPRLSDAVRASILMLVEAASAQRRGGRD